MDLKLPKMIFINTVMDSLISKIISSKRNEKINLSFEDVEYIYPDSIILLIALSKYMNEYTNSKVIWKNTKEDVYRYLVKINIKNISYIILERKPLRLFVNTIIQTSNKLQKPYIPELKIMDNPLQCQDIIEYTSIVLNDWFQDKAVVSRYMRQITDYIMAIAGNSLEHSESEGFGNCYYSLQRYPSKRGFQLKLAIGDTGMGIKNSLKSINYNLPDRDSVAIKKAFIEGMSCREDQSGGLGFLSVRNTMSSYGGEVAIRSGDAVIHYDADKDITKTFRFQFSLPGTQTVFQIN